MWKHPWVRIPLSPPHFFQMYPVFGMQKYPSGRRGSPAKGVGRETVARVQIPPSAPIRRKRYIACGGSFISSEHIAHILLVFAPGRLCRVAVRGGSILSGRLSKEEDTLASMSLLSSLSVVWPAGHFYPTTHASHPPSLREHLSKSFSPGPPTCIRWNGKGASPIGEAPIFMEVLLCAGSPASAASM